MELTKLLFNNLSVSKNSLKPSSDVSMKSEGKFDNCLNKASYNKKTDTTSSASNKKNVSNNKNSDKVVKKADLKQTDSLDNQNSTDNQNYDSSKKTEDSKNTELSQVSQTDEKKSVVLEKESELKQEIAQILGVQPNEVENVLEQLGINVFELSEPENLINFLQELFNADSPSDLLSIDGIKDIMISVKETVEEKISDFADLFQDFDLEDFKKLNDLKNSNQDVYSSQEDDTIASSEDDTALSQIEDTFTAEKTVNHTAAKNQKDLSQTKNQEDFVDSDVKDSQIQNVSTKVIESTAAQNNGFNQQGFQNNSNMNSEANSSFNNNGISAATFDNIDKAFSQIVSKTQSMKNVNTADVINQIIEKFKAGVVRQNVNEIKITLKPEYLGDVSLKLVSQNGIVSAQFTAENQRVKEIIESNFNQLKNMLDEQGVQVSALSVSIGSEDSNQNKGFDDFRSKSSKSSKRINNIINSSAELESESEIIEDILDYSIEDDILQTSVNYTA